MYISSSADRQRGYTLRMCDMKTAFLSEDEAKKRANEIAKTKRKGKPGPKLRPYHCPHCQQWHLTKQGVSQ